MKAAAMNPSRRLFLKSAAAAGVAGAAFNPWLQLNALADASSGTGGYKALVCVFLHGGNDGNNLLLPYEPDEHALYSQARGILGLARDRVLPIAPTNTQGRRFALHPSFTRLQGLFDGGQVAALANVGPLVVPTTKTDYQRGLVALPPNLFSHADQQAAWQTDSFSTALKGGWGGRMLERLVDGGAAHRGYACVSLGGGGPWGTGDVSLQPYRVPVSGSFGFEGYMPDTQDALSFALDGLVRQTRSDPFEAAWLQSLSRSMDNQRVLTQALGGNAATAGIPTNTELGQQLSMAARLIQAQGTLGLSRQCFFCSVGGFDTHGDDQLTTQRTKFAEIDEAIAGFYTVLQGLGLQDSVTLFTASDFGRTLVSNGHGSDHGWGSHHLVVGGAVKGGRVLGTFPDHTIDGPDDIGGGNWVPTMALDQFGADLGRWFGAGSSALDEIFPRRAQFDASLALMKA